MAKVINPSLELPFNPKGPTILHIDLNSCFATIEQQANPKLRGKPIAVAAYTTPSGCILAPSVEAKKFGIKTGMRVKDGKMLYPKLIVLSPDPMKYRSVHIQLKNILLDYTDKLTPKSIDEFVLDLEGYPAFKKGMVNAAEEIKDRIKAEIGEWLTVSIGIAPNRFLAKTAAGLHKPDGLDVVDKSNYQRIYHKLGLMDLCGIKAKNAIRLNHMGIFTIWDFYKSPVWKTKAAFESVLGYYWYLRLRGWEIDDVDFSSKSYGNSYALPKPLVTPEQLSPILQKLVEKTGMRLRRAGYRTRGVHVAMVYRDNSFWHQGVSLPDYIFDSRDIYKIAFKIMTHSPYKKPVRNLAESVFNLQKCVNTQMCLFEDIEKKEKLTKAVDEVNERWGNFVITPARMIGTKELVADRIAFGGVKELEEAILD
ncbi:DNA polymerase IV [Candidatus Daviesbacteria bacterium]|nr:DNA polymerase IV [Candidatus Daviesbacteria bacterium]